MDAKLLLVEDEGLQRDAFAASLRQFGWEVHEAQDGVAALDMLQEPNSYALVVLDLRLPGINGLELIEQAKRGKVSLPPILIVSAHVDESAWHQLIELKVEGGPRE